MVPNHCHDDIHAGPTAYMLPTHDNNNRTGHEHPPARPMDAVVWTRHIASDVRLLELNIISYRSWHRSFLLSHRLQVLTATPDHIMYHAGLTPNNSTVGNFAMHQVIAAGDLQVSCSPQAACALPQLWNLLLLCRGKFTMSCCAPTPWKDCNIQLLTKQFLCTDFMQACCSTQQ